MTTNFWAYLLHLNGRLSSNWHRQPALQSDLISLNYGQLTAHIDRICRYILGQNYPKGMPILVCIEKSPEAVAAIMAVLQAGYTYIPLDPAHAASRIDTILADTHAQLVITRSISEHLFQAKKISLYICEQLNDIAPITDLDCLHGAALIPEHTAYITYTSGSTGTPKGVCVTHHNLKHLLQGLSNYFQASPCLRFVWSFSIAFDGAVVAPFLCFAQGTTLLIPSPNTEKDPELLRRFVAKHAATHLLCLPSQYDILLENAHSEQLQSLKTVVTAGEICPPALPARHYALLPQTALYNAYGPTEATVWTCTFPIPPNFEGTNVPIGQPTGYAQIYLLDNNWQPILPPANDNDPSPIGQIAIVGPLVAKGYITTNQNDNSNKEPILAPFAQIPDPKQPKYPLRAYLTGDLARYLPDGNLIFMGRADRQVKHNGYRIELDEIENTLLSLENVKEAAVVVINPQTSDQKLKAFVTLKKNLTTAPQQNTDLEQALKSNLSDLLPAYMLPAQIICLPQMPLTPIGKIDRKQLATTALPPTDSQRIILPETPNGHTLTTNTHLQQYISDCWKKILHLEQIDPNDKFFELGGTSLQAARFVSLIQQEMGQTVFIVSIFDNPTIASYAAFLEKEYPNTCDKLGVSDKKDTPTSTLPLTTGEKSTQNTAKPTTCVSARAALAPYIYHSDKKQTPKYPKNPTALFILAPPRSGTSLLRLMFAGHPQLLAANELQLLHFATMGERQTAYSGKYSLWREGLVRTLMALLKTDAPQARQWIARYEAQDSTIQNLYAELQTLIAPRLLLDKSPSYCLDYKALEAAENLFENPMYIQLLRHPSAAVQSFAARKMHQVWYMQPHNYTPLQLGEMIWTAAHQNIADFFEQVPPQRRHTLRYEDLVQQPEAEMRRLCRALSLPYLPELIMPYNNIDEKMADATQADANPMSDPTLLQQIGINPTLATARLTPQNNLILKAETQKLATQYGYTFNETKEKTTNLNTPSFITIDKIESNKQKNNGNKHKNDSSDNNENSDIDAEIADNTGKNQSNYTAPIHSNNNSIIPFDKKASEKQQQIQTNNAQSRHNDVAIIGISGRFAGAENIGEFWENLLSARDLSQAVTADDLSRAGLDPNCLQDSDYVPRTLCLANPYDFDADFFGLHRKEAELSDPQHRLLLELAYTALEDAGYNPTNCSLTVGIFGGIARNAYLHANLLTHSEYADQVGEYGFSLGNEKDFALTRIAYKLNLNGPAINIQTACSSSGTALHIACQSLLVGDCDMAIVIGCRIESPAGVGYWHFDGGPLSADGYCRAFDEKATGMVRGSGGAAIVLKKADQALNDRDTLYALIKGTALNNDGDRKIGFTAPSVGGQAAAITKALQKANLLPEDIGYVETHGTGTRLGDPIEVEALQKAFAQFTDKKRFCAIGSVKANIGHLDAGSCLAGVIKTALMLKHRTLLPQPNFDRPNPQINFDQTAFYVHTQCREWVRTAADKPLRAGVNSLGLGGTNAHIVLEEAPVLDEKAQKNKARLLVFSAKTPTALQQMTARFETFAAQKQDTLNLGNAAFTLQIGRQLFANRCFAVGTTGEEALRDLKKNTPTKALNAPPPVIFMFTGGGAQYLSMAKNLWAEEPYFARQIECCQAILDEHHHWPAKISDVLSGNFEEDLEKPSIALPLLLSLEYALAKLWLHWGIVPTALIGHSLGEYAAACIAGIFSLEDALALAVVRGRLFDTLPVGAMLNVPLAAQDLMPYMEWLAKKDLVLDIAALNCTGQCVLSGNEAAINSLQNRLAKDGIEGVRVPIQVAAHSYMVTPILTAFEHAVQQVTFHAPQIPLISNLDGQYLSAEKAATPSYWAQHLRQTVRFADGLRLALMHPNAVLLEVGPGQTLSAYARRHTDKKDTHTILASLPHHKEQVRDDVFVLRTLGKLWALGVLVNWKNFGSTETFNRIALPTYPFERKTYLVKPYKLQKTIETKNYNIETQNMNPNILLPIENNNTMQPLDSTTKPALRTTHIAELLQDLLYTLSGMTLSQNDHGLTFLELGFDSLFLTQFIAALNKKFGVMVQFRQLFENAPTLEALAQHLDNILPNGKFMPENPTSINTTVLAQKENKELPPPQEQIKSHHENRIQVQTPITVTPPPALGSYTIVPIAAENQPIMAQIIQQQLQIMQQQLALLGGGMGNHLSVEKSGQELLSDEKKKPTDSPVPKPLVASEMLMGKGDLEKAVQQNEALQNNSQRNEGHAHGPWKPIDKKTKQGLDAAQKEALQALIDRYTARTRGSKQLAETQRTHLADARSITGFNKLWKEMTYQIAAERSKGSRIWDVDGNEYIDFTMGFGINLFGHNPEFAQKAILAQLEKGVHLSVLTPLAKQVADLLCEITQNERCTFVNTGSEGVAAAVRAARTVSGRTRIAVFEGDYHGIADELLVKGVKINGSTRSKPVSPGIPDFLVENVLVLDYNDPNLWDTLRQNAADLAAVIVEPLTPQFPHVQHGEILQKLRHITEELDIALVFDELITGFRLHPQGAQGWFGIQADICSYGKILCGGLPLAAVAGKAKYLDVFDGGTWHFGDDSFPAVGVTFFGGTFVRHPLSLATSLAALQTIQQSGMELYEQLHERTAAFAAQIRQLIRQHRVPLAIYATSSIIALKITDTNPLSRLFFFMLREKGIHITERAGFLSSAHSTGDLQQCLTIIEEVIIAMKEARFFEDSEPTDNGGIIVERVAKGLFRELSLPENNNILDSGKKKHNGSKNGVENLNKSTTLLNANEKEARPEVIRLPLTINQEEIWLGHQLEGEAAAGYNLTTQLHFEGEIDITILTQSLQMLIERHDSLRTIFEADGQQQIILPYVKASITTDEAPQEAAENYLNELRQKAVSIPFDLTAPPLFRTILFKHNAQKYTLLFTVHHIIADGWSLGTLTQEWARLYTLLQNGLKNDLPEARQMRTYIGEKNSSEWGQKMTQANQYWLQSLQPENGRLPVLDLPNDRPRPPQKTYRAGFEKLVLPAETVGRLRKVAAKKGTTLFAFLLAGFYAYLSRITARQDLITGVIVAGQSEQGNQHLVGHCVSLLPLRLQVEPKAPFGQLLNLVRSKTLDLFEYQQTTLSVLLRQIALQRDNSRNPLVSVVFNMDAPSGQLRFGPIEAKAEAVPRLYESFDLFFNVKPLSDTLAFECTFNADLFDGQTWQNRLGEFAVLLAATAADNDSTETPIEQLPLLTETQRLRWLNHQAGQALPIPTKGLGLHQLVEKQAAQTPENTAIRYKEATLTYADLNQNANRLACYLLEKGLVVGSRVGILMERSPEAIIAILAVLKAGGIYVPLDINSPMARLLNLTRDAQLSFILSDQTLGAALAEQTQRIGQPENLQYLWYDKAMAAALNLPADNLNLHLSPQHLAYIIYTSGSTGQPKGVMITHASAAGYMYAYGHRPLPLTQKDIVFSVAPLTFDPSVQDIFLTLATGACLHIAPQSALADGFALRQYLERAQATVMQATPATWQLLIEAGWQGSRQLRLFTGGEGLTGKLAAQLAERCCELWNIYGPTETTVWATAYQVFAATRMPDDLPKIAAIRAHKGGYLPVGSPVGNAYLYILDNNLQLLPQGIAGEIYIGGQGVAAGYLRRDDLNQQCFIPNPFGQTHIPLLYRTGDIGRILPDGNLEYLHRADLQVKIRGHRIELGEIEAALATHPNVEQCVVTAIDDERGFKQLAAYIVLKKGASLLNAATMRDFLRVQLPEYMLPQTLTIVESFAYTHSMKVDRKQLPAPSLLADTTAAQQDYTAPETESEKLLAGVWQDLLKIAQISRHDNFFDLGGHSLIAVQVMASIKRKTGKTLPLSALLERPTIARLAQLLDTDSTLNSAWKCLVTIKATGSRPPLYMVHGAGLHVLLFNTLATLMDNEQPIYGLQAYGLNGQDRPFNRIEDIATYYLKEILQHNPNGPYYLAGYSFGGLIAFEMAKQLANMGKKPAFLGLVDTAVAQHNEQGSADRILVGKKIAFAAADLLLHPKSAWRYRSESGKRTLQRLTRKLFKHKAEQNNDSGSTATATDIAQQNAAHLVDAFNGEAFANYVLSPYDGRIHLFRAKERRFYVAEPVFLGWQPYCLQGVEVHSIEGDHHSIFTPPNNKAFAHVLQKVLNDLV